MLIIILLLIILYFLCKTKENFSIIPTPNPDSLEKIGTVKKNDNIELKTIKNFSFFDNLEKDDLYTSLDKINKILKNNFNDEKYHINEFINLVIGDIQSASHTKNITILIPTNGIIKAHANWNNITNYYNLQLINHCFLYPIENNYFDSKNLKKIVNGINDQYDFISENIKIKNGIIHIVNFIINKTIIPYKKHEVFIEFQKEFNDTYIPELYNFGQ
jgi:hypothetical protein